MNDVVVGVDRSETARSAAHKAARLAEAYGANLHLVTCAEPTASVSAGVGSDRFETDWVAEAEQFLKGLAYDLPYDRISWNVASGDPAKAIVEEAERVEAGTIVVGNVRTHGVSRVLGSVATSVVKRAPCDVLVAHTT
ncbi:MAG: universal stress protein [Ilumatobacter sp.]|nr:universal stress protein [Ilumatobacter sp.]